METMKWLLVVSLLAATIHSTHCQVVRGCPSQERILPCRCLLRDKEYQIWCSHSDLPRVLEGLKAIGQYIFQPIDELILENNNLPSLPGKAFLPLKVMRLMLRYNSLERVSNGWLAGLEDSLMELFIVEPDMRSLPEESLHNLRALEAVTIQTNLMKRLPKFSNLPKLRYLQIESLNLVELSPRHFKNLQSLEKVHIHGSPRLERLEASTFQDLPRLQMINISFCGISWMHLRSITRLETLVELSLVGNKISDVGMVGRGARDLPALETLRLDFNEIDRIGEATFVDLPSLKKLYLSNNRITELHHGAFHRVPVLRMIDLSNNLVQRVHPESFLQNSGSGLEELWLMNNDISHIAELRSLLDALPRLTFLDMSHNNLEAIPFGALRGHPTLEELHLDYNKIHIIDREAFMAMPALRELRLRNNSLTDRLETPFWNLPALKGLDLSANFFRRIESRLLTNIPSLRKLDLSSNDISMVDPTTFLLTPDLEHVNLSHNALASLHPATFRHLLGLYELDVSYNGLLEFVPGLPRGIEYLHMKRNLIGNIPLPPSPDLDLPALRMLDVSSNGIQRIPAASLRTLSQLRKLYIGKNALQQLEENSLTGLSRLEILDLRENRISKIHPFALKELSDLSELNLRKNRLDILIPDLFQGINHLRKLDISRNQLTEVLPGTLENTRNIEIIDASHNSLVHLPPGLYGMKNLRVLDLTDNRLKNIHPDTLNSLASLEELRMSRNFVQEIRSGAFNNLPNLKVLHLDNNELVEMETKAVHALPSLKSIKLGQNRLTEIPNGAFSELPSVQMLELQENELKLIGSGAFHQTPHLVMLNLSYNHIVGLEDAGLASLRSLEMLDLSNNQLSMVASPSLEKMEWLVELRLDNNKICSVHGATFNGMPRLRVLSLRNNKMMTFPEHAVQKLRGNIAVLDIDGNPLACTCSLLWLRAWLQEQSVMGPRCLDGSLLRELRLSRQECVQEERLSDPVAPGCEAELLSVPGTYATAQVFTNHWMNLRDNKTKQVSDNNNNVAQSPEDSDYFYDDYVDYPYNNDSSVQQNTLHVKEGAPNSKLKANSSHSAHFIAGDTPVIYAAASRNKTKIPDTPKGVVGSPSSSGFTFFGLPLPSLNLNNILGGSVRMADKRKTQAQAESINAERKTAIVNKPSRQPAPEVPRPIRKPPDLPARPIIGMVPPSHPEIHTGGFIPLLPGSGGFTPIIPNPPPKFNFSYTANVERVNVTQATSSSVHAPSTVPPNLDPTFQQQSTPSFISKRGPSPSASPPIPTQSGFVVSSTFGTMEKPKDQIKTTVRTPVNEDDEEYEDEDEDETVESTKVEPPPPVRVQEIEQIKNLSKILTTKPTTSVEIETGTGAGLETFEDIFKEVVENVSLPPTVPTETYNTPPTRIENLVRNKDLDLITSFSTDNKQATNGTQTKKEVIGTPLSALLVPGGQQPQYRPSGRPTIMKVPSPHVSDSASLQSDPEVDVSASDDEITPLAHNREAKNGFGETSPMPPSQDDDTMSWYFANYNKTNLEPYIGNGMYPTGSTATNFHLNSFAMFANVVLQFYIFYITAK